MKIKTFQFCVSNAAGNNLHTNGCYKKDKFSIDTKEPYDSEKGIDKKLNRWIEKNNPDIHDIKITTYTVDRHNNGGDDTVIAIYTILYDPAEPERDHGNTDDSADYGN